MSLNNVASKIVKINIFVFLLWYSVGAIHPSFMIDHFLVSWSALGDGRIWTLATSIFSHNLLMHILINMLVFYNFGVVMEEVLGSKRFLVFYLSAGLMGSILHCTFSEYILHQPDLAALGASGAVTGVVLLFALLFPAEKIYIFGLIPVPAIWAAIAFTSIDVIGLISQGQGSAAPIGYGAHLGGATAGIIYFIFYRRRIHL